jgi:hypothetical protein
MRQTYSEKKKCNIQIIRAIAITYLKSNESITSAQLADFINDNKLLPHNKIILPNLCHKILNSSSDYYKKIFVKDENEKWSLNKAEKVKWDM